MIKERKLSMPFWCVGNPVADPFGSGVLAKVTALETAEIIANAGKKGLIHYTAAHDCDLVKWNPENPEDDLDTAGDTCRQLKEIKAILKSGGIQFKMGSAALHPDPVFRNGGLSNPDSRVRALAAQKVMRALRIINFLGGEYFTYWVARDGFETQFSVPWDKTYSYIRSALNLVPKYCSEKKLSIKHGTIEYKPNEPRGEMYLPTVGHAIAMIMSLDKPDFWGVNPEVLQHDSMTNLSPVAAVAFALSMNKLLFLHVGSQKAGQFDNDNPPLLGMDGLKELVSIFYILNKYDWKGYIEFDNHMFRTDAAPGEKNRIKLREKYIELCVDAYRLAEAKAFKLASDKTIASKLVKIWKEDKNLDAILAKGDTAKIQSLAINYKAVVEEASAIGELDLLVNKKILST
ncbi:MAG: hypothetical protein E4H36_10515 [Spirochaetales bacterium]|nr:MAG: hypothetical protein E4H36_10515 [Spirochaetales bacterium]